MASENEIVWRIAGGSGDGIDSTSQNFAKALMRSGLHVFTHRHYPSRIRGGHTFVEIRASDDPVKSRGNEYDFLLALGDSFARTQQTEEAYYGNEEIKPLTENLDDLSENGVIVYDSGVISEDELPDDFEDRVDENNWNVYPINLREIAKEQGMEVMRNTAGVAVSSAFLEFETEYIENLLDEVMGDDIFKKNMDVFETAYSRAEEIDFTHDIRMPEGEHEEQQVLLSASAGVAYGALDEGCQFIAGYPMTPWTDVFSLMSNYLPEVGGVAEQVEDEIAAASLAIGASHAGAKAMSGSSGGGLALMSEPLGMAEMTETPLVLVEAMRGGPSTGLPTKPEQGDLEHVLYTSQGDSCRVVLAPGNVKEAYTQTRMAFRIAYEYQLPVIVVIDQKVSGELRTVEEEFFNKESNGGDLGSVLTEEELEEAPHHESGKYSRYQHNPDGNNVSPRSLPGQKGGRFLATGNEHNEQGHISEDPENRRIQHSRRMAKLEDIREELDDEDNQAYYGNSDADIGIITWGSQKGTVEEAINALNDEGENIKGLGVSGLMPYPAEEVQDFIDSVDNCIFVEMNASSQFQNLTRKEVDVSETTTHSLTRFDGNPIRPQQIVDKTTKVINNE